MTKAVNRLLANRGEFLNTVRFEWGQARLIYDFGLSSPRLAISGHIEYVIQYESIEPDPIDSGPTVFTPNPG